MLNKIDLPAAQPDRYAAELANIIGVDPSEVLRVSAKTGKGVEHLLHEIVRLVPAPKGDPDAPARGAHLRLDLRHLPRRGHLRPGGRRTALEARAVA